MRKILASFGLLAVVVPAFAFASFETDLEYGDTGNEVVRLQQFLTAQGHFGAEITGNFFGLTLAAVQAFQIAHNILPGSGFWGPITRARANAILAGGASSGSQYQSGGTSTQTSEIQSLLAMIAQLTAQINQLQATQQGQSCTVNDITIKSGTSATFYNTTSPAEGVTCASRSQTRTCNNGSLTGSSNYRYSACTETHATSKASCSLDGVTIAHNVTRTFYSTQNPAQGSSCAAHSQARTCSNGSLSGSSSYNRVSCTEPSGTMATTTTAFATTTHPLAVSCSGPGQVCDHIAVVDITAATTSKFKIKFDVPSSWCSSAALDFYLDGTFKASSGWLGWNGATGNFASLPLSTGFIDLGTLSTGDHVLEVEAEGQVSGCNSGRLQYWSGDLTSVLSY